jgi:ATP-dependent Clp protease ATP-binding subunit ClpX
MEEGTCLLCGAGREAARLSSFAGRFICDVCAGQQGIQRAMADLAARRRHPRSSRRCSLCGSQEHEVVKLISGPGVFICDGCVGEGQRLVSEGIKQPDSAAGGECAFCRKTAAEVEHLVGGEETLICDQCLDLCDQILSETISRMFVPTTFALWASSSETRIVEVIRLARQKLAKDESCAIAVLIDPHTRDAARTLLQRLQNAVADGANVWEPARQSSRLGVAFLAYPRLER